MESSLRFNAENLEEGVRNLADTITSVAEETSAAFPYVSVELFETHGEHTLSRSKIEAITYAPLVSKANRGPWEEFSWSNQGWIERSRKTYVQRQEDSPVYLQGQISPHIYQLRDGIFPEPVPENTTHEGFNFYAPVWYLSPPPLNPAIVNFDMTSQQEYQKLLQRTVADQGKTAFSPVMNVEPFSSLSISDLDHWNFHRQFANIPNTSTGYNLPHSMYAQPVYRGHDQQDVVGILLGAVAWDAFLHELLPSGVMGITLVLNSHCEEEAFYTYMLNSVEVSAMKKQGAHKRNY